MLVRERMTQNPITVSPDLSVPEALRLMREKKVRRFPVVDSHGKLVGIVSDKDLLQAGPSSATTLAIWEITELLGKLKVAEVMSRDLITVQDDTPLEEAARIMADHANDKPTEQSNNLTAAQRIEAAQATMKRILNGARS